MFRAAKQSRVFQDVLEQIEEAIVGGKFTPGDKLPPERELRDSMEISRATLREALRVLEQKNLIEIKVGVKGGAYVKKASIEHITDSLGLLIRQQKVSLAHLYEFREGNESIAVGLATERASENDFDNIQTILDEAEKTIIGPEIDLVEFYVVESRLHKAIAKLSGNPIYEWVLSAVHSSVHRYAHLLPTRDHEFRGIYEDWIYILEAMRNRSVARVQALITAHVVRSYLAVTEKGRQFGQPISNIMVDLEK